MATSADADPIKALSARQKEKKEAADRAFRDLVVSIADGEGFEPASAEATLDGSGRTTEDLDQAVKSERERRRLDASIAREAEVQAEAAALEEREAKLRKDRETAEKKFRAGMASLGTDRTACQLQFDQIQRDKIARRASASDEAKAAAANWAAEMRAVRARMHDREGRIGRLGPTYVVSRDAAGRTTSAKSLPVQIDIVTNQIRKLEHYIARCAGPQPQEESRVAKLRTDREALERELTEASNEVQTLLERIRKLEKQDDLLLSQ